MKANRALHKTNALSEIKFFVQSSPARMALIISVVLFAATSFFRPNSFNLTTVSSLILSATLLAISAAGQTMVIIGGGMDFSVGAVMSMSAIITTGVMDGQDGNFFKVLIMVLAMGAAVGLVNGLGVVKIGLPALIVTMAISNVVSRLQYVFTAGSPVGFASPTFQKTIVYRFLNIFPSIMLYGIILLPIVFFLLHRSRFGNQIYMVGSNRVAARLNGVEVNKVVVITYIISGMLSAFAGMLGAGYIGTSNCQMFDGYAFTSLVAVIVGGTSFSGGIGTLAGTMAGSLLMVQISNSLTTLALSQPIRNIFNGVLVIVLLILYNRSKAVRQ